MTDLDDCCVKQLLLHAFRSDKEVEQGHLDGHLGRVVGVGQFAGHVEPEVWVVRHHIVPNLDHLTPSLQARTLMQGRLLTQPGPLRKPGSSKHF